MVLLDGIKLESFLFSLHFIYFIPLLQPTLNLHQLTSFVILKKIYIRRMYFYTILHLCLIIITQYLQRLYSRRITN